MDGPSSIGSEARLRKWELAAAARTLYSPLSPMLRAMASMPAPFEIAICRAAGVRRMPRQESRARHCACTPRRGLARPPALRSLLCGGARSPWSASPTPLHP